MSLFEVLIILTLGSAAGDVAFYDDVPMLPVLAGFYHSGPAVPIDYVADGA
ncbi:inner membrane protein [Klebsiella michiganensis]|uniref:Inner membrane protein n=1 Tax=Klebsiella michiganensis TaxID=1134687 RepID=A0A7H4N2M8_9ENTR|nr:inner membrane protein [Klebsiella michiganensis]